MKSTGSTYNPETDAPPKFYPGVYPAYISGFELFQPATTTSAVCKFKYRIAEEANGIEVTDPDTGKKVVPLTMIGKEFEMSRDASIWFNSQPIEGDEWKNANYIEFVEGVLGLTFPRKLVGKTEVVEIQEIEDEDVIGIPVWVTLNHEVDKKTEKKYMKVFDVKPWDVPRKTKNELEEDSLPF